MPVSKDILDEIPLAAKGKISNTPAKSTPSKGGDILDEIPLAKDANIPDPKSIPGVDAKGNAVSMNPDYKAYIKPVSMQVAQGVPNDAATNSLGVSMDSLKKFFGPDFGKPAADQKVAAAHVDDKGNKTVTQYDLNNGDPKITTTGISEYEKQNAQFEVGKEVSSAQDYLTKDFEKNSASLAGLSINDPKFGAEKQPDAGATQFASVGQLQPQNKTEVGDFGVRLVNPNGDAKALEDYMKSRLDLLNQSAQTRLQDLDAKYPLIEYPIARQLLNDSKPATRENEDAYNLEKEALASDIKDEHDNLTRAAFALASLKSVNDKISRGVHPSDISPTQIGMEVRAMQGDRDDVDRQQRFIDKGMGITPSEKVDNEIAGYRAMQYTMMDQFSKGHDVIAQGLADKVKNYRQKILDNNPDFKKQQLVRVLSDELYKDKSAMMRAVEAVSLSNKQIEPADVDAAATRLGIPLSEIKDISVDDIITPSNLASRTVSSFVENTAAPIYKSGMRILASGTDKGYTPFFGDLLLPANVRDGAGVDQEAFNKTFDEDWYDNTALGKLLKGGTPDAMKLFGASTQVETDKSKEGYLFDKQNPNSGKFNWDLSAMLDQVANGAGQIAAFATVGGKVGEIATANKIVSSVKAADRLGISVSTFLTQHEGNYENALQVFGDKPEDEDKRVLYSTLKDFSSAITEMIYPDQEIARNILGPNTMAGREFIDYVQKNGIKNLDRQALAKIIGKGIFEGGKDWAKETSEDYFDNKGDQIIDYYMSPKTYASTDYTELDKQTVITSAISSFLPTFSGGAKKPFVENRLHKEMLFHVGVNADDYTTQIKQDQVDGKISESDANEKTKLVNTMQQIVYNSVPTESIVNGQVLTHEQQVNYANNLLQQAIAKHQKEKVGDDVQVEHIQKHIDELKTEREKILASAGEQTVQPTQSVADGGETNINSPQNQNNGNNQEVSQAASSGNQNGSPQVNGQGQQGNEGRQEQNVLNASGVGGSSEVNINSGKISSVTLGEHTYSFESDLETQTNQNATTESNQQQPQSNQQGGIDQHTGVGIGQQEAGQGAGSERQGTQSPANGSNSDQRSQEEKIANFQTSRGSVYTVNEDGSTQRDKVARTGDPESGLQDKSDRTYFLDPKDAERLSEINTQGESKIIAETNDGRIGVMYLTGKDQGKFEERTIVTPKSSPEVGTVPLEVWDKDHATHFGSEITEVTPQQAAPVQQETSITPPVEEKTGTVGDNIKKQWDDVEKTPGIERTRTLADGSKLPGRYVLTTADAMTPSHSPETFGNSKGFPMLEDGRNPNDRNYTTKENKDRVLARSANYNGLAVENIPTVDPNGIVIDGNDRVMSGLIAARQGTDTEYIQALKENAAGFGFTADRVDEMIAKGLHPRVVFVANEAQPYNTETFAKFNQRTAGKAKTNEEEAAQYGRTISEATVARLGDIMGQHETTQAFYDSKPSSKQVKDLLVQSGVFTTDELPRMYNVNTQQFTEDGKRVLQNVVMGKVFNEEVLSLLNKYKTIRNQVLLAMSNLMAIEGRPEFSIKEKISEALRLKDLIYNQAKDLGIQGKEAAIVNYLRNVDMFYTPSREALSMLHILDMGKQKSLQEFSANYLQQIANFLPGTEEDMFGQKNPSAEHLILQLNDSYKQYEQALQNRSEAAPAAATIPTQSKSNTATTNNAVAKEGNQSAAVAQVANTEDEGVTEPILDESALAQVNDNVEAADIEIPVAQDDQELVQEKQPGISAVDMDAISSQALPAEIGETNTAEVPLKAVANKAPAGPVEEKKVIPGKPVATGDVVTDAVNNFNWLKNIVAKKEGRLDAMQEREDRGSAAWRTEEEKEKATLKALYPKLDAAETLANKELNRAAKEATKNARVKQTKETVATTKKKAKEVADTVRKAKIKGLDGAALTTPVQIPVSLWNASVETVALALEAGGSIVSAVQEGVDYVKDRWFTKFDEVKMRDLLGENSLFPVTPDQIRSKLESIIPLSVANKTAADQMIANIQGNKLTLPDAINAINSIPNSSDDLKNKIKQYVTRSVNESIFKATGTELADKFAVAANGNFDEAMTDLLADQKTAVLNSIDQTERDNIRMKYAAALSELQSRKTTQDVLAGKIKPVYRHEEEQFAFNPARRLSIKEALKNRDIKSLRAKIQEDIQDRYARLARMMEASIVEVNETNDALSAQYLKDSKADNIIENIRHYLGNAEYIKDSFFARMKRAGIDEHEMGLYQYAKHAEERNEYNAKLAQKIFDAKVYELNQKIAAGDGNVTELQSQLNDILAQRDPNFALMPDGGSGMTDAQAREILAEVEKDGKTDLFDLFDKEFRENVTNKILDYKYDSQIINDADYNKLKTFYSNYVPLKVDITDEENAGSNNKKYLANSGASGKDLFRSKGSVERTYAERNNPLLQSIVDLENAVRRSEENKAALIMATFVKQNPNPNIWKIVPANYDVVKDQEGNVLRATPQFTPKDAIPYYDMGKKNFITLYDEGLKNMIKQVGLVWPIKVLGKMTGVYRKFAVGVSPEFIIKNPIFDLQDAYSNLLLHDNKNIANNFKSYLPSVFTVIKQINSGKDSEWNGWVKEWKEQGGDVSFLQQFESSAKNEIQSEKIYKNYGKVYSRANYNHYTHVFSNVVTTLEQMTRVMAYRASIEAGINKQKAAVISRNATLDFAKKGVYGAAINSFKVFANASTQGIAGILYGATKRGPAGNRYRSFLAGAVGLGFIESFLNSMVGDCNDETKSSDCWWLVAEYEKQKSLVLPASVAGHGGTGYFKVPIGRQFGWFNYLGKLAHATITGNQTPGEASVNALQSFANYYNPAGGDAPITQQMTGNLSPITGLYENKNSFGGNIVPDRSNKMASKNYTPNTGAPYVAIAKGLHNISGGTDEREGAIEVSPNQLSYVTQSVFSGLYSFIDHSISTAHALATPGEALQQENIPLYRVFRIPNNDRSIANKYYEIAKKSENNILTLEEDGKAQEYLRRLGYDGVVTPDQQTKWYGYIKRNQTTIKNANEKENPTAVQTPDVDQSSVDAASVDKTAVDQSPVDKP